MGDQKLKRDNVIRDYETTRRRDYRPSEVREDFTGQGLRDYGIIQNAEKLTRCPVK
jgi:hypothetical protein